MANVGSHRGRKRRVAKNVVIEFVTALSWAIAKDARRIELAVRDH